MFVWQIVASAIVAVWLLAQVLHVLWKKRVTPIAVINLAAAGALLWLVLSFEWLPFFVPLGMVIVMLTGVLYVRYARWLHATINQPSRKNANRSPREPQ